MAAPCLLRTVVRKVCSPRLKVFPSQWMGQPAACTSLRLQHSDSSDASSAAEAEKTPVVIDNDLVAKMLDEMDGDMPVSEMTDPFQKEHKRCILCVYNMDVDYKNVRLLSQFVSPFTGRIYGRAVTGLCIPMQRQVARAIKMARTAGFMPYMVKTPEYLRDPRLFDPFKPASAR